MALRESTEASGKPGAGGASALAGLPAYWDVPECPPKIEWEKCWDLFLMAVKAKYSISVTELTRFPTQQRPRQAALINNLNEEALERKTVSILFLSLGAAGQKNLTDKFPYMSVATVPMREIKENCESCFKNPKNRILDIYNFFARRQQQNETLRQFWNVLTGLAARCEFGEQTNSLIEDAFKQSMNNKTVQRRLCTEPNEKPEEALKFVVALEEGISQQKSFSGENETKAEPVYQINERVENPCTRCGAEFTTNHLQRCKAIKEQCRSYGVNGHFARMCRRAKPTNQRGNGNFRGNNNTALRGEMRRINLIDQANT